MDYFFSELNDCGTIIVVYRIKKGNKIMKKFYVMYNVGRVKYLLNTHDGITTHKDGSPFYGCECFNNKKKLAARIAELKKDGYTEKY